MTVFWEEFTKYPKYSFPVIVLQSLYEACESIPAQDQEDEPPETSSGLGPSFSSVADT